MVHVIPSTDAAERAFLAPLPIELADPSEEQAAVLAGWGVRTLGELTALPRAEAAMRLGEEGAALWDRAAGRDPAAAGVLRHAEPPRAFEAEIEFEDGIETLEPLLFLLRRFCDQLALQLAAANFAAAGLHLVLTLCEGKYARDFRLPSPTGDAGVFFRVLHTHLETLKTDTPVVALRLAVTPTRPLHRQQGLFDSSLVDPHGLNETLARVGAVVGSERVGAPVLENTRRPDAVRLESVPDRVAWQPELASAAMHGLPLRRHRPPRPARVETEDGRPVWVLADGMAGPVVAAEGPWRGSGEWWCAESWSRDEWDVEIAGAGLHRIFESAGQWFVEGEYD
jgi:protein ImuB